MEALLSRTTLDAREAFRFRAWELHLKGWTQPQIAEALGVNQASVSRWIARAQQDGVEALRSHPAPGAPRRLTADQLARLPALLGRGAEAFGFRGDVWTHGRIARVIDQEWGVEYSPRQIGRLLQKIGWSWQRPQRRARQRNEAEIRAFRDERWSQIKKGGASKERRSSASMRRGSRCCRWL